MYLCFSFKKYRTIMLICSVIVTLTNNAVAQQSVTKEKIAVVGAGLAGLTFTLRLQQKNHDVELYEARPRVGGRVHTIYVKNLEGDYSTVELGGQNVDDGGESTNMLSLIKEFDLKILSVNVSRERIFYDGNRFFDLRQFRLENYPFSEEEIKSRLKKYSHAFSLKDVMEGLFPTGKISPEQSTLKRIFTLAVASYEGSTADKLSAYHNLDVLGEMMYTPPDEKLNFWQLKHLEGGNSSLTTKIAEKLGKKVHLNKVLQEVAINSDNKILLRFKDGEEVTCDKLVLAIPAPVYKDITFSNSTVPSERLKLINKVQYGTNTKAIVPMKYKEPKVDSIYTDNIAGSGKSLVTWLNEDRKLLTLYFAGNEKSHVTRDGLYNKALDLLKLYYHDQAYFNEQAPVPAKEENFARHEVPVIKSWIDDPYSKGSYSNYGIALRELYDEMKSYKGIKVKTIFTPIDDRIFFIGEHATIIPEVGTMEAAVESAERTVKLF